MKTWCRNGKATQKRPSASRDVDLVNHVSHSSSSVVGTAGAPGSSIDQKRCNKVSIDGLDLSNNDIRGAETLPRGFTNPIIIYPKWLSMADGKPAVCNKIKKINKVHGIII